MEKVAAHLTVHSGWDKLSEDQEAQKTVAVTFPSVRDFLRDVLLGGDAGLEELVPARATSSDAFRRYGLEQSLAAGDWRRACATLEQNCWPLYFKQDQRRDQLIDAWHRVLKFAVQPKKPSDFQRVKRKWGIPVNLGGYGSKNKCWQLEKEHDSKGRGSTIDPVVSATIVNV